MYREDGTKVRPLSASVLSPLSTKHCPRCVYTEDGTKAQADQASLAEEGLVVPDDSSASDPEDHRDDDSRLPGTPHGTESPLVPHSIAGDTTALSEVSVGGAGAAGSESGGGGGGGGGDQMTYENRAFNPELAISGSLSGSEHGLSTDLMSANDVSTIV